jgi:HK97 family phage portal protein
MRGNHYAKIIRNELGQAIELQMLNPDKVTVYEDVNEVYYKITGDNKVYRSSEIIHVPHLGDGIVGKGTIAYAKEDLGLEMSRRDYGSEVYNSGARPPAILTPKTPIQDADRVKAQDAWDKIKRKGKDVMLPFGIDYTPMSFKPEEVEFLQSGNFSVTTIARWLGVPPHKLFDLERATLSNIEHLAIEFLQDTIAPILVKFEAEYSYKLFQLHIEEKRGYYCEFNMNAYVRADLTTRANAMATQVHAALLMPSEGREMENREFVDGSDRLFINQGSAPLDLIDQIAVSKRPVTNEQKEKLKALLNGKTDEALKILE